jgi:hypothetical protein
MQRKNASTIVEETTQRCGGYQEENQLLFDAGIAK